MDNDPRRQRVLHYPFLGQFTDTLTLNGSVATGAVDPNDMTAAWKPFALQTPQCIGPEVSFDCLRTSHDDLCAYPPKCPTTNLLGSSAAASSHMLFHTRHYPPPLHMLSGNNGGAGSAVLHHHLDLDTASAAACTPTNHQSSASLGFCPFGTAAYGCFDDDFVDQLSALSSPTPQLPCLTDAGADGDSHSVCDSECGDGEICHDSICSDDPSACCEDESCLQDVAAATGAADPTTPLTSEDTSAAVALASFGGQTPEPQQQHHQHHQHQQHQNQQDFVMGADLCISPQFLTNYQHLREAHNPLQPAACNAPFCPVDDPNFYAQCHIKHVLPPVLQQHQPNNYFDQLDLSYMMPDDGLALPECGARFRNPEAMVAHFWNEHRAGLPAPLGPLSAPLSAPHNHMFGHVPGIASSAASTVSSSQDLLQTPADGSMALPEIASHDADVSAMAGLQHHECLWCHTIGGRPCGLAFESAGDLHKHTIEAHTHPLKRDVGGTYSCGWMGCNRRDGEDKGGFAQKSKIDRHMQVHTGNKPFLCDICGQSFSANQALVQHKLIHADIKPLSCDICGKTFRQHSALTMHIRTHTKVRPLKCPYCNKEFSESSNLSKHKRIHTGDGLYVCHFAGCGKHFHRKDQLRRHSAQHSKARGSTPA